MRLEKNDTSILAQRQAVEPIAREIGLLNYHWNSAHLALMRAFSIFHSGEKDNKQSFEHWHKEKSDRKQRKILESEIIKHNDNCIDNTHRNRFINIINFLDEKHETRNALIHSCLTFKPDAYGWQLEYDTFFSSQHRPDHFKNLSGSKDLMNLTIKECSEIASVSTFTGESLSLLFIEKKLSRAKPFTINEPDVIKSYL